MIPGIDWLLAWCDSDLLMYQHWPVPLIKTICMWKCLHRGCPAQCWAACHSCLATVQSFRQNDMDRDSQKHLHSHIQTHPYLSTQTAACTCTQTQKNQVSAHVSVWTAAWATASWHSLCKDNIKGENLVYLPPLKIIQTRSLFSSFFLLLSFLSHPPPSAELGFLLTLALRAAVYEAELMHIQHLL